MSYQLTITDKPTYLHAIVTGQNGKQTVTAYLNELFHACTERDCFRVLIEERLEGPRLSIWDVFEIATGCPANAKGLLSAVAYIDVHAEQDLMQFAETVATNRGMPVRVFASVFAAERWLEESCREAQDKS